jgi:hypothetical protein
MSARRQSTLPLVIVLTGARKEVVLGLKVRVGQEWLGDVVNLETGVDMRTRQYWMQPGKVEPRAGRRSPAPIGRQGQGQIPEDFEVPAGHPSIDVHVNDVLFFNGLWDQRLSAPPSLRNKRLSFGRSHRLWRVIARCRRAQGPATVAQFNEDLRAALPQSDKEGVLGRTSTGLLSLHASILPRAVGPNG